MSLPRKSPPLGDLIKMVASLGGYVESKAGGSPGVNSMAWHASYDRLRHCMGGFR